VVPSAPILTELGCFRQYLALIQISQTYKLKNGILAPFDKNGANITFYKNLYLVSK
jgi:hypothetical protein